MQYVLCRADSIEKRIRMAKKSGQHFHNWNKQRVKVDAILFFNFPTAAPPTAERRTLVTLRDALQNPIWSRWAVFQYSDCGKVAGINGNVDMNCMEKDFWTGILKVGNNCG
ncbi:hypothetical protein [Brevibacillus laterosporus]|uniref:hypothetical protein n=1 Tax=Brevibacillus laterosporus TaxID=1465 RepID=UPI00030BB183|nr:hypothetical protein [Brevibacillus laterosporus]